MMKGAIFFRSFGAITLSCFLFFSSEAQIKRQGIHTRATGAGKLWSPLSGTGLQHALADASHRHFDAKSKKPKVKTNELVAGSNEPSRRKYLRLMAKR